MTRRSLTLSPSKRNQSCELQRNKLTWFIACCSTSNSWRVIRTSAKMNFLPNISKVIKVGNFSRLFKQSADTIRKCGTPTTVFVISPPHSEQGSPFIGFSESHILSSSGKSVFGIFNNFFSSFRYGSQERLHNDLKEK